MDDLETLRKTNNPDNQPVGHFTGRCANCHSKDLWDDATAYGCNCCGALFMTGDILPKIIENGTGKVVFNGGNANDEAIKREWDKFHE